MKEYDDVELIAEKDKYARYGVHKGMQGWICHDECVGGYWLVNFPQFGGNNEIATISVHESDMKIIEFHSEYLNEFIRAQWGESDPDEIHPIEVIAERNIYAKDGVHKGMQGWTHFEEQNGDCHAYFPYTGIPKIMASTYLKAGDWERLESIAPHVNERVKAEWDGKI